MTPKTLDVDPPARGTLDEPKMENLRHELTAHCRRMLGSAGEAEDAVQETMLRGWNAFDSFEGRSALRTWLYRIATNVCLDMAGSPQRRARPVDLRPSATAASAVASDVGDLMARSGGARAADRDPANLVVSREAVRAAFAATLQHLPPLPRAVLILREVLGWPAADVARLLGTTTPSVNSALQRARASLANRDVDRVALLDPGQAHLLETYLDAFERADAHALATHLAAEVRRPGLTVGGSPDVAA